MKLLFCLLILSIGLALPKELIAAINPLDRSGHNGGLKGMELLSIQGRLFVPGAYQYSFQPSFVEAQHPTAND